MGEPSIFKMKRKPEDLAKILPVFACSWLEKAAQRFFFWVFLFFLFFLEKRKMRGEIQILWRALVMHVISQAIVSNVLYSTVASSLARSFKRNMSEKYSQYSQPVFGYTHCENRLGDQPDFSLMVSALRSMHTDLCGQR